MNQNVMNIVDFYERQIMPSRQTPVAHPRAVRPGSAGKLLAMEELYNGAAITQMQAQPEYFQVKQEPATPVKQDRYGFPITPQSIHRSRAPRTLNIPTQNAYISNQGAYAPTSNVNVAPTNFAQFPPSSADRASFPSLDSPMLPNNYASPAMYSAQRGHTRNHSTISMASSIGSAGGLFFPESNMDFMDASMSHAPRFSTPPSSPKKRKSPTKSPSKGKDRPNFLDKAIMRDTGVTQEQINSYIGEPTAADPKNWRCVWEGCSHLAARKENIRAHVQTHLGDRPYECPECHADFVRSHDFTRHYTTHVDSRDFKCPDCPQAFNRADALQRHRDRDFCNGLPPDSPTKVRRVVEAIDKKKDTAGRRSKKQATRKKRVGRQDSVDLSGDDFWSSSGGSPEYFSSDAGSPEMVLDSIVEHVQSASNVQQAYAPIDQANFTSSVLNRNEEAIERIFASLSEEGSPHDHSMSLSPPLSPEQKHQILTPFSPSPQRKNQKQHEMTPPASRESMLEFLSAPSVHGNNTLSTSAPSPPGLSSASPSPLAFEPATDFDDFCNSLSSASNQSWLDPRMEKSQADAPFDFAELMDSKVSSSAWMDENEDLFGSM